MKRLGVTLNLSSAFHPQTDGQSKRTIGTLEDIIRPYVCDFQKDWDQYLDQPKFAYSNSEHTSTGQTPFLVTYGQHPNTMDDVHLRAPPEGEDPPAVQEILDSTERARTLARYDIEQLNFIWLRTSMLIDAMSNSRSGIPFSFPHRISACQ
jgi:hypothetical protein